jgi:hypothetical protein
LEVAVGSPPLVALRCLAILASQIMSDGAYAQTPSEVLAAQLRDQGYHCEPPLSARRDARLSRPDAVVWFLKCRGTTFRIRLDPDMAAHVEKIN